MFSLKQVPEITEAFSKLGRCRYVFRVLKENGDTLCFIEYWTNSSCAFNSIWGLCYDFDELFPELVEFLKTQPQTKPELDGKLIYPAKIFTILPGHGHRTKKLSKMTTPLATFPNHAHGGWSLTLHLLDLTKV
jgi:hypothetical protein